MRQSRMIRLIFLITAALVLAWFVFLPIQRKEAEPLQHDRPQAVLLFSHEIPTVMEITLPDSGKSFQVIGLDTYPVLSGFPEELIDPAALRQFVRFVLGTRVLPRQDLWTENVEDLFAEPVLSIHLSYHQEDSIRSMEVGDADASGEHRYIRMGDQVFLAPGVIIDQIRRFPAPAAVREISVFDAGKAFSVEIQGPEGDNGLRFIRSDLHEGSRRYSQFFPYSVSSRFSRPLPVHPEILEEVQLLFSGILVFSSRLADTLEDDIFSYFVTVTDEQQQVLWERELLRSGGKTYYQSGDWYAEVLLQTVFPRGIDLTAAFMYLQSIEQLMELSFVLGEVKLEMTGGQPKVRRSVLNGKSLPSEETSLIYRELLGFMYSGYIPVPRQKEFIDDPGEKIGILNIRDYHGEFSAEFFQNPALPQAYLVLDTLGGVFTIRKRDVDTLADTLLGFAQ